jgi:tetratricopeptide (TPR) repeat protein
MRALSLVAGVVLLGVAPSGHAQTSCAALTERALARYRARADYAVVVRAARQARECAGAQAAPDLYAAEAWGLVNDERWEELVALGEAFSRRPRTVVATLDVLARVEGSAGVALVVQGRAAEGFARQRAVLAWLPATRPLLRASALSSLAWSYGLLGAYAEADTLYEAMTATVERHLYGPARRPLRLRARSERAGNLLAWYEHDRLPDPSRRLALALNLAREAYTLSVAEADEASAAIALLFEGEALHYLGDLGAAEAALRRVQALPDATYWPYAEWDLARIAARRGRDAEALRRYDRALTALDHDAGDARDLHYEVGALHERAGRLGAADAAYRASLAALDRFVAEAGTDDSWLRIQSVWQRPYRGLSRIYARQGRFADALTVLDAAHARFLRLYRARAAALDTARNRTIAALLAAQEAVRDSLADATTEALRQRLAHRDDALRARLARLTPALPSAPLDVYRLQRVLRGRGQVLVAFLLDAPEPFLRRPAASFAFVVTADTVAGVTLALDAPAADSLVAAISPVLNGASPGLSDRGFSLSALHALYARTFGPVQPLIGAARRIVVVPDGPLFHVPMAALVVQRTPRPVFLGATAALSTEVAAQLLLEDAPRAAGRTDVLVAGRSRFSGGLPPLAHVRRETAGIHRRLRDARVLLDGAATEPRVLAEARQASVLHLATHTDLRSASPLYYALHLSPGGPEDGLLRLHELQRHSLPLGLVVLSGCAPARARGWRASSTASGRQAPAAPSPRSGSWTMGRWPI